MTSIIKMSPRRAVKAFGPRLGPSRKSATTRAHPFASEAAVSLRRLAPDAPQSAGMRVAGGRPRRFLDAWRREGGTTDGDQR